MIRIYSFKKVGIIGFFLVFISIVFFSSLFYDFGSAKIREKETTEKTTRIMIEFECDNNSSIFTNPVDLRKEPVLPMFVLKNGTDWAAPSIFHQWDESFCVNMTLEYGCTYEHTLEDAHKHLFEDIDDRKHNLFIMGPSFVWMENKLLNFMRLRDSNGPGGDQSYIWHFIMNESLQYIDNGEMIAIPNFECGSFSGPEDPRAFLYQDRPYIIFNMKHDGPPGRSMFVYNINDHELIHLRVNFSLEREQKNWSPLIFRDKLFFVYNLDPLFILHCEPPLCLPWYCGISNHLPIDIPHILRGGTPFVHYKNSYYVSFAHLRFFSELHQLFIYRSVLVVLFMGDDPHIVYMGNLNDFEYFREGKESIPIQENSIQFPYGFEWEQGKRCALVGISHQDRKPLSIRICGFDELLEKIIGRDIQATRMTPGYYQNKLNDLCKEMF